MGDPERVSVHVGHGHRPDPGNVLGGQHPEDQLHPFAGGHGIAQGVGGLSASDGQKELLGSPFLEDMPNELPMPPVEGLEPPHKKAAQVPAPPQSGLSSSTLSRNSSRWGHRYVR
jgi:hypothetical protein